MELRFSEAEMIRYARRHRCLHVPLAALLLFLQQPSTLLADSLCDVLQVQKVLASDGAPIDLFGYSVSISDEMFVVGAYGDDDGGDEAGAAYIFTRRSTGWVQTAKLRASDINAVDFFGGSVAISGETVVIGAHFDDDQGSTSGSAYVFERRGGSWVEVAKLTANDGASGDIFGESVAIDGDTIVVGAPREDEHGHSAGAAYVFSRLQNEWFQTVKLFSSDGEENDNFGDAVAISNDIILIGATGDDDNGLRAGAAYVFERDGDSWSESAKLLSHDGGVEASFGHSVSIEGTTALVGAYGASENGKDSGAAYVFSRVAGQWLETAKLIAPDGASGDLFGASVAIASNFAVIGAYGDDFETQRTECNVAGDDHIVNLAGSVYVFTACGDSWYLAHKCVPDDNAVDDLFGSSVAISGPDVVVGARQSDDNGSASGSAYVIQFACYSPVDFDQDRDVDSTDFAFLLAEWGANTGSNADVVDRRTFSPPPDGVVDGADLAVLLGAWGPCD